MEKHSFVSGLGKIVSQYTTLPSLLEQRCLDNPQKAAYVFRYRDKETGPQDTTSDIAIRRRAITFSELTQTSLDLAAALLSSGVEPNDRVAIIGSNCPEFLFVDYACLRISVLLLRLPINLVTPDDVVDVTKRFNLSALFIDNVTIADKITAAYPGILSGTTGRKRLGIQNLKLVSLLKKPEMSYGLPTIEDLLKVNGDVAKVKEIQQSQDPDDFAITYPTSGSTGKPKFSTHSHCRFVNSMLHAYEVFFRADIMMSDRPFSWAGGFVLLAIIRNMTNVYVDPALLGPGTGNTFVQLVREENVSSTWCMVSAMYDLMKTESLDPMPPCFQNVVIAGEQVPKEVLSFARETFRTTTVGYGLTEVFPCATSKMKHTDDDQILSDISWLQVAPGMELKIVDGSNKLVGRNVIGNVHLRSEARLECYLDEREKTDETLLQTGWVRTGDLGMIREDGRIRIVGRKNEVISRGGIKVYPTLTESLLLKHPKVQRAAVVGVPDPRLYNEVCAFVIPKAGESLTEDELSSYCKTQVLDDTAVAVPRYFFVVDEFPSISTGKIDKIGLVKVAKFKL